MPPPPPPPPPGSPGPRRGSVDGASSAHPPDDPAAPPPSSSSRPPTAPAHEFRVESGSREFVPPTAPGGVRYPLPSGASAVLFDPGSRKLRLPSGGRSRAPSASGAPPRPPAPIGLSNGAPTTPTAGGGAGGAGDTTPPGKAKRNSRRHSKQPLPSWREEWQSVRRWWVRTRESGAKSARERTAFDWAACFLPCLTWLRSYNVKENLMWDVLAGVSVGFMVVPQSMSYANLAGLPPQYGLYAAFVPLAVYAVFGSCRQLGVGPVAITSALIANGLKDQIPRASEIDEPANPPPDLVAVQEAYSTRVIQLAFIVGCMYTGIGLLRLGFLVRFLSHATITSFTSAAVILIGLSQVKYILGVKMPRAETLQENIAGLAAVGGKAQWQEVVMGCSAIAFLLVLKFVGGRWPRLRFVRAFGPVIVCAVGIGVVASGVTGGTGKEGKIKTVGTIPQGLPPFSATKWVPVTYDPGSLLGLAAIVTLVDLLESTSIARALARKHGYSLVYGQEVVGLGLANIAGAMFSAYTATGSFSRSAVNNDTGAKTQLAGFITSMVVLLTLLVLTPILKMLPYTCMAAIIIVGLTSLFEMGVALHLLRVHLRDFFVWVAGFLCTLFLGVELGLAISIGLAVLIVIFESAFPHTAVLGRVERSEVYRNIEQYPDAELVPGILIVRLDAPVYFANVQWLQDKLVEYERAAERFAAANGATRLEYVVLDLTPVPHLDSMGSDFIVQLSEDYAARGIRLALSNPNTRVLRMLDRSGATLLAGETPEDAAAANRGNRVPREWVFVRVHDAVNACLYDMSTADGGEGGRGLPTASNNNDGAGCSADLTAGGGQRAIARVSASGVLLGFEPVAGGGGGGGGGSGGGGAASAAAGTSGVDKVL